MGENSERNIGQLFWNVQPVWVKIIVGVFAIPAWALLAYDVVLHPVDRIYVDVAAAIFSLIGMIELLFIAKAYWLQKF